MTISLIVSYSCLTFEAAMLVSTQNVSKYLPECTASHSKRECPANSNVFGNMSCKAY